MPIAWISSSVLPESVMTFVMFAYLVTLACVIIVELHPHGRMGRVAAVSSIIFVTAGGAAWSYAALYQKSQWPKYVAHQPAEAEEAAARRPGGRRGREIDPEADSGSDDGSGESPRSKDRDEAGATRNARGASPSDVVLANSLGLANRVESDDEPIEADCDGCPAMVRVPAGTALIGAPASDAEAAPAERPQRHVRFWPGFMISAEPISAESFREFMTETGRRVSSCGPVTASRDWPQFAKTPTGRAATCVMPGDADAYAAWLSARTGMRFRLPKAAEAEFASRTLSNALMHRGDVAELVADCWHASMPEPGRERIAAQALIADCDGRTVMGAARLSARRKLGARETDANIGFRVVRAMQNDR